MLLDEFIHSFNYFDHVVYFATGSAHNYKNIFEDNENQQYPVFLRNIKNLVIILVDPLLESPPYCVEQIDILTNNSDSENIYLRTFAKEGIFFSLYKTWQQIWQI